MRKLTKPAKPAVETQHHCFHQFPPTIGAFSTGLFVTILLKQDFRLITINFEVIGVGKVIYAAFKSSWQQFQKW